MLIIYIVPLLTTCRGHDLARFLINYGATRIDLAQRHALGIFLILCLFLKRCNHVASFTKNDVEVNSDHQLNVAGWRGFLQLMWEEEREYDYEI